MNLTGKELAGKIGCARSTLSEATNKGYLLQGRYDVQEWAEFGPSGRVQGYDVPEEVPFCSARENPNTGPNSPNSANSGGDSVLPFDPSGSEQQVPALTRLIENQQQTTQKVAEETGDRTQLVSDETDVSGSVRNATMGYVAGKAIEHNTPGALAFWTVGSGLAGGIGGYTVSDGNPWAAFIGAALFASAGYLTYQQPYEERNRTSRRTEGRGKHNRESRTPAQRKERYINLREPVATR